MVEDIGAWRESWKAVRDRSRAFRNGIAIDLAKQDFAEILILLGHSIHACVSSQALLLGDADGEGLAPLSRKIFESYVQLKYLARHPEALRQYAFFESLKTAENREHLLRANRDLVAKGEAPLFDGEREAELVRQAEADRSRLGYFASLGLVRKRIKNRYGKEVPAKSWFENHRSIPHIGALAEMVGEKRTFALFYPAWSASQHGQTVSQDYALRLSGAGFETRTREEFRAEGRSLFRLSFLAGAMSHLVLVLRFRAGEYQGESEALGGIAGTVGLEAVLREEAGKVLRYGEGRSAGGGNGS